MRTEPGNTEWAQYAAQSTLELGALQLSLGDTAAAGVSVRQGCDLASRLLQRDSSVAMWRAEMRGQCLDLRGKLALARNALAEARSLADQYVGLASREVARNRTADTLIPLALAQTLRGDVAAKSGDQADALRAWKAAAAAWPEDVEHTPAELAMRAALLQRLGRKPEAAALAGRLEAMGYRHPDYVAERKRIAGE